MKDSVIESAGTTDLDEFVDALGAALGIPPEVDDFLDGNLMDTLTGIEHVVMEDWKIYEWMLEKLAWDQCRTARGIGAIEYICRTRAIPYSLQGANIKQAAVAGGAEELYYRPLHENRHQNDSLQHAVYWHVKRGLPAVRHGKAVV